MAGDDDIKLTPEAVRRLLAAPSKKRLMNGWYNEVTREAKFARRSYELSVSVTHPRLTAFGTQNSVELRCWQSCVGHALPVTDELAGLVAQLTQEATMTNDEAEAIATNLSMVVRDSMQTLGFQQTLPSATASIEDLEADAVGEMAHWLARDGASCQKHVDIAGVLLAQSQRIRELEQMVSQFNGATESEADLNEDAQREALADELFEEYDFGDGVEVVAHDSWNTEDSDDLTKIVYVRFDDDPPDADSHKLSFHVRFENGEVDAYALDMRTGNDVGSMKQRRTERETG